MGFWRFFHGFFHSKGSLELRQLSSPDAEALKHGAPVEGRRVAVLLRQDL